MKAVLGWILEIDHTEMQTPLSYFPPKVKLTRSIIILAILFSSFSFEVKADQWTDPSWKEMIDSSDVIALIEYTSRGDFRAQARPLIIYKGRLKAKLIWISGFSNRYGPIDKMRPGDRYIVFLNFYEPTERTVRDWTEEVREKPELKDYFEALKAGNAYYVWSPTSGDLRVQGKKVQYDLLQTTYYDKQAFHSLDEFETFLTATTQRNKSVFHTSTLETLKSNVSTAACARYLMMLYLTSFKSFDPVYQIIADRKDPEANYALAQLLGQIDGEKSRDILVQLMGHENSVVQGEAVRQLSDESPEFIGEILLAHLSSAGTGGMYRSNVMNPVMNEIDGGKIEIIKTIGKLKYKPAVRKLLPLLETEDAYFFRLLINVLLELDSKDFIPYVNEHLIKQTKPLIFEICQIITENDLKECVPSLMEFISSHNRNDHPSYEYAISKHMGLAHFENNEIRFFLMNDFEKFLNNNDTIKSGKVRAWISEYIETFKELRYAEARRLIYKSLFYWFGYDEEFGKHPQLVSIKTALQDSINQRAAVILKEHDIEEVQSLVHITNAKDVVNGVTPDFEFIVQVELANDVKKRWASHKDIFSDSKGVFELLKKVRQEVSDGLALPLEKVSAKAGMYVDNTDDRFDVDIDFSPMNKFYQYAKQLPNQNDLLFLKALAESGFTKEDFDKRQLNRTIVEIEEKLNK